MPVVPTVHADTIAHWKEYAARIGVDFNTIWTQWIHTKALMKAIVATERVSTHPEAHYLYYFVCQAVVDQIVLGLRRQIDSDKRAQSLLNLLRKIEAEPDVYSLAECRKTFRDRAVRWNLDESYQERYELQASALYEYVADSTGIAFDISKLRADMEMLKTLCANAKAIADTHIAHNDATKPEVELTVEHIDEAVAAVKRLSRKYTRLFDGGGDGEGVPDEAELLSIYRFAWMPDEGDVRAAQLELAENGHGFNTTG